MASISAILQDIALDPRGPPDCVHRGSGGHTSSPNHHDFLSSPVRAKIRKRKSTREKIESMVTEGSKNYPAYLKLIYTGESDFSSEDECGTYDRKSLKSRSNIENKIQASANAKSVADYDNKLNANMDAKNTMEPDSCFGEVELENGEKIESPTEKVVLDSRQAEKPRQKPRRGGRLHNISHMRKSKSEDSFYDTIETSSPDYDNSMNNHQGPAQDPEEQAQQREEWMKDLAKLEEEINTLRTVLSVKVNQAADIKRKMGVTPMTEFRHDLKQGFQNIKESDAYRKTNEGFSKLNSKITNSAAVQKTNEKLTQITETIQTSDAYQKTNSAFKSFGAFASKKLGDMRNSNTFKSFEEKVGGAYTNVKTKVSGSKSENSFAEALQQSEPTTVENPGDNTALTPDTEKQPL